MPFLAQEHYTIPTNDIPSWTFDNIKYDQDQPIYIDALNTEKFLSARQAKKLVRQLVAGFRALGLQKGDCVCMHSANHILYPLLFMGVVAGGGVYAATNPAYTTYEMVHALKTAKVKFVVVQPDFVKAMEKAMEEAGLSRDRLIVFNPDNEAAPQGYKTWSILLTQGEADWLRFDSLEQAKSTEAARLFSSGTTGLPKAASLSHYNLIAEHTLVYESVIRPWYAKRLLALPMFHAATAPSAFCTPLRAGEPAYVLPRFELEKWFWAHQEYEITDVTLVPPIAIMAINSPLREKYNLKAVRSAAVGAAPLDKLAQARFQRLISESASFTQVWGMTETSCVCTRFPYPETDVTGSVGRPMPNIDLKLVDDNGKDISGYDVRGELCVRGPTIINGYFENAEANQRDWDEEGFFHTGDIAYCDGKTNLWYIVDRKKELIKVRGFQVTPPELEGLLLNHPSIVDVAVIGVPAPEQKDGEFPRAYLVRRPGSEGKPTEKEIHDYMRDNLASYKQLVGGVVFVEAIPKNASGKILKRVLREQAKREMGAKL
ncbi:hypothetical protein LTR62_007841 [Meristemomyces frigidus]|uniref:Uncharacterized protein n=1 Tax=Meristemomyces frigidus TaxID=1508187 RepID=A0AAN7TBI2_9PEZI|nr:hypothetical protein LTR62_007841 [Meristemomyces frigidus]